MKLWHIYWSKICEPLDGFLWHKDISHPIIRPLLRNEILAAGSIILLGAVLYVIFPWIFWFGIGTLCMTWIFWSWARFFLSVKNIMQTALITILLSFLGRLIVFGVLLYVFLAICLAPATAIISGMILGTFTALVTYWRELKKNPGY